jgi:hypothetical protein
MEGRGPTRGESDVEFEIREVEANETVEHVEEEDAARFVSAHRIANPEEHGEGVPPEREPVFETVQFQRWAETRSLSAVADAAAVHVNDELGTDEVRGGIGRTVEEDGVVPVVAIGTEFDQNGAVVSEPTVDFDVLVATTPATADVTYRLDDREYELETPVYSEHEVVQQQ